MKESLTVITKKNRDFNEAGNKKASVLINLKYFIYFFMFKPALNYFCGGGEFGSIFFSLKNSFLISSPKLGVCNSLSSKVSASEISFLVIRRSLLDLV